jgi:hypothetical protein
MADFIVDPDGKCMRKDTWTGNHHWIPRHGDFGNAYPKLWEAAYGGYTTFLEHDPHVQVQRNTRKYGPIVARSLWEMGEFADFI